MRNADHVLHQPERSRDLSRRRHKRNNPAHDCLH
jgi:hypothetical protein